MHQVKIDNITRFIPSTWNELSRKQLLEVCTLFNRDVIARHFKRRLLQRFLNVNRKTLNKIDPEDIYFLSQSLNFLLEDVKLTKAIIGTIRYNWNPFQRLYGPDDSMGYCTFGEFTKAQVRYEQYQKTHDPAALDEMIAILFRRKKRFWWIRGSFTESTDPRVRYLDRTLARRTKMISRVDPAIKKAVLFFFSGVQDALPEKFPNVYRSKPQAGSKSHGWATLIITLADGKTDDQSLERIMNSNLYNVFLGLEQKSIEYFEFMKNNPTND